MNPTTPTMDTIATTLAGLVAFAMIAHAGPTMAVAWLALATGAAWVLVAGLSPRRADDGGRDADDWDDMP